jgi:hypothetical protein
VIRDFALLLAEPAEAAMVNVHWILLRPSLNRGMRLMRIE